MKRMLITPVVITLIALCSSCSKLTEKANSTPAPAAIEANANAEQELRARNLEYDNAILRQDAAALERLYSDDIIITKVGGKQATKAQEIATFKSGETKFELGRSEDVKIRLYGNTAIVNGRWIERSATKGTAFNGAYSYTTVYVKKDGSWQIVSDQVTPIAP